MYTSVKVRRMWFRQTAQQTSKLPAKADLSMINIKYFPGGLKRQGAPTAHGKESLARYVHFSRFKNDAGFRSQ